MNNNNNEYIWRGVDNDMMALSTNRLVFWFDLRKYYCWSDVYDMRCNDGSVRCSCVCLVLWAVLINNNKANKRHIT
jgi:hypothetical protein